MAPPFEHPCDGRTCRRDPLANTADQKSHRLKTFKMSSDPDFAEKVFDVVGLYLNPLDNALDRT